MTEYWKSQARKFCEFCKCWFADNKVSISFHENGKRHKESVQKHISQLTKRSAKEAKVQCKIDDEMKKMEAAAMAAYLRDVQNNADLTSQGINEMLGHSTERNVPISTASNRSTPEPKPAPKPPPIWHEIENVDGGIYFWNTETNDTTWDPPDEYVSLAQQEKQKLKEQEVEKRKEDLKKEQHKESVREINAYMAREKMKKRAVKKDPPAEKSTVSFGPAPRAAKPFGSWTPVVNQPVEKIDLQLPKVKELPPPPVIMEPEEKVQFKEKRIQSLGGDDDGPVEFKRRKVSNAKRNMRQKNDDE